MNVRLKAAAATGMTVVAILTVCLLVISVLPKEATLKIDPIRETVTNGHIIYEDFSGAALPESWDKTYPYVFLNSGNSSTGLDTQQYDSHIAVQQGEGLTISAQQGEHIITLPDLGTENFVYSIDVSFKEFGGSVGLVLDLPQDYGTASRASFFLIEAKPQGEGYLPTFSVFSRLRAEADYSGADKNRTDIQVSSLLPECVQQTNSLTGEGIIPDSVTLTLKAYHYKNVSYFYCNDVFVASLPDSHDSRATRVGIFSDAQGKALEVTRVSVDGIILAADKKDELYTLDTAVDHSFTKDNTLPLGWSLSGEGNTQSVEDGNGKALALTSMGGEAVLTLPAVGADNYSFTVKMRLKGEGYAGLAADLSGPESRLAGADLMLVASGGEKDILHYNNTLSRAGERRVYSQKELLGKALRSGDTVTLGCYVVGSNIYFYINGGFISCMPADSEGDLCGIYVSGGLSAEILSAKVYRLAEKGTTTGINVTSAALALQGEGVGLTFTASLDSENAIYTARGSEKGFYYGVAIYPAGSDTPQPMAELTSRPDRVRGGVLTEADGALTFTADFTTLAKKYLSGYVNVCGYLAVESDGKTRYFYGESTIISLVDMANELYPTATPELQAQLDSLFSGAEGYMGIQPYADTEETTVNE